MWTRILGKMIAQTHVKSQQDPDSVYIVGFQEGCLEFGAHVVGFRVQQGARV